MPCTRTHSSPRFPVTKRSCRMGWTEADDGEYGRFRLCVGAVLGKAGINATVSPEVTTSRFVCTESSMDVIGFGKASEVVSFRVRRSHHLRTYEYSVTQRSKGDTHFMIPSSPADTPVCSPTQTTLFTVLSCGVVPGSPRRSASASGRARSNMRTFFSCPPVSM